MRSFIDNAGREWRFTINIPEARRIRQRVGIDLLDGRQLKDAVEDQLRWIDLMFAIVEPQAKASGVTDEMFGLALEGCLDEATEALTGEIADFFRRLGRVKAAEAMEVGMEAGRDYQSKIDQRLNRDTIRAMIDRELEKDLADLDAAIAKLATGSPGHK